MREIKWRKIALNDLLGIVDYIAGDNPDAAQRLHDEIKQKVLSLAENPLLYRTGRVPDTREMTVRNHYVVVYRFDEKKVYVLRVLHTTQSWP
ncbi:type II toxin-antitoxin system RelE/ParE family toxin [Salmonella enterica]|nr:type II toxin-antitoxin system RelE/ParE family toxin [Salmonella enterica]